MAASLVSLPSIVIFSGTPWRRIALVKNCFAAFSSRCSVRRKSTVFPCLSTARAPLALHLDICLVHTPTHPHRTLAAVERFFELRAVFDDPAVNGGVIQLHSTFLPEFF